jgi:hypothetical protein
MNLFTNGQKTKMRRQFSINGPRNSFINSFVCDSSMAISNDTIIVVKAVVPSFNIYPNPATNVLNIEGMNGFDLKGKVLKLYTSSGVLQFTKSNLMSYEKINISQLHSGVYFLSIISGRESKVLKLIKQ